MDIPLSNATESARSYNKTIVDSLNREGSKPRGVDWNEFDGYEHVLSHYFRTLFEIVRYVDSREILTPIEKYQYMTVLRSNMSTYEQSILFIQSVVEKGKYWELEYREVDSTRCYVTKYNLVRNMNRDFFDKVDPALAYPMADFEFLSIGKREDLAEIRKANGYYFYPELLKNNEKAK